MPLQRTKLKPTNDNQIESTSSKAGSALTGHDLEAIKPLPLEARDDLVGAALQVGLPGLDVVEDVDGAAPGRARGGVGRVPAEHLAVHGLEVDDGHCERPVHVEDHPAQRPPPLGWRGSGCRGGGHGPASEAGAAGERRGEEEEAVGAEEQVREHTWRDLGCWMAREWSPGKWRPEWWGMLMVMGLCLRLSCV